MGLIECAVRLHRQVVNLATTGPLLQCEPQLSCRVGPKKGKAPATEHQLAPAADNYSCLRCKHAACDVRSCSRCTSHKVKNSSVDDRATGFTKSAKWHDCDRAALLLWHMFIAKNADAVVVRCPQEGGPHVGVPWQILAILSARVHLLYVGALSWTRLFVSGKLYNKPTTFPAKRKGSDRTCPLLHAREVKKKRSAGRVEWPSEASEGPPQSPLRPYLLDR